MNTQVAYKSGFKYVLEEDLVVQLEEADFRSRVRTVNTKWIDLTSLGVLKIYAGFACDGPSGFTIDTKTAMRASFVHDALYWLMRNEFIDASSREAADRELRRILLLDGMNWFRARYWYHGVRLGGGFAIDPASSRKVHRAPKMTRGQQERWWNEAERSGTFKFTL